MHTNMKSMLDKQTEKPSELVVFCHDGKLEIHMREPKDKTNLNGDWQTVELLTISETQTDKLCAMLQAVISARLDA